MTLTLANLRRTAPAQAAQAYQTKFQSESEGWDQALRQAEDTAVGGAAQGVELDVAGLERVEEMRRSWERGTETLANVKDGIGATVARLERAEGVAKHLEGQ